MKKKNGKKTQRTGGPNRFEKGAKPGPGRPPGMPNKVTREVKELALALISIPEYQQKFRKAFVDRTLEEKLEVMIWAYAYGKPVATVNVGAGAGLAELLALRTPDPE